jgi:hypothetical protein
MRRVGMVEVWRVSTEKFTAPVQRLLRRKKRRECSAIARVGAKERSGEGGRGVDDG